MSNLRNFCFFLGICSTPVLFIKFANSLDAPLFLGIQKLFRVKTSPFSVSPKLARSSSDAIHTASLSIWNTRTNEKFYVSDQQIFVWYTKPLNQAKLQEKSQNIQKPVLNGTVTRDFLGRPISTEDLGEGENWGGALWYPLMGPGQSPGDEKAAKLPEAPLSSKEFLLWNHKLLIKIYPPQPVMKLSQHIFSKILPKLEFKVNF